MAALGDKIAANILAQTAKVPSIPWSGDGLTCQLTEDGQQKVETRYLARLNPLNG
jgi:acetyl-CoA carboxylase/biotin carboxylase 1